MRKFEDKIFSLGELINVVFRNDATPGLKGPIRNPGKLSRVLVTTNGVFDIVHPGHCKYLEQCKERGEILLVLVNSDESVKRYKGPPQPYNPLRDRQSVLASLESVDYVTFFDGDTPELALQHLYSYGVGPHFHVKGGDWQKADMPETQIVEQYGGEIVLQRFEYWTSTSGLVERIVTLNIPNLKLGG